MFHVPRTEILLAIDLLVLLVFLCLSGPSQEWGAFTKVILAVLIASIFHGLYKLREERKGNRK